MKSTPEIDPKGRHPRKGGGSSPSMPGLDRRWDITGLAVALALCGLAYYLGDILAAVLFLAAGTLAFIVVKHWPVTPDQYRCRNVALVFVVVVTLVLESLPARSLWSHRQQARTEAVTFAASLASGDYPKGTVVGGIRWTTGHADLRVDIINSNNNHSLTNLELLVSLTPRYSIFQIGQVSNLPNAHFTLHPDIGGPIVTFKEKDTGRILKTVPISPSDMSGTLWRVYCERLFPNTALRLVMDVAPVPGDGLSQKVVLTSVNIAGAYNLEQDRRQVAYLCRSIRSATERPACEMALPWTQAVSASHRGTNMDCADC